MHNEDDDLIAVVANATESFTDTNRSPLDVAVLIQDHLRQIGLEGAVMIDSHGVIHFRGIITTPHVHVVFPNTLQEEA